MLIETTALIRGIGGRAANGTEDPAAGRKKSECDDFVFLAMISPFSRGIIRLVRSILMEVYLGMLCVWEQAEAFNQCD